MGLRDECGVSEKVGSGRKFITLYRRKPRDRTPASLSIPQLRSYSTKFIWPHYQIVDPLILTVFNLVGANTMPLNLRYSSSVRCTVETCLRTGVPPLQIADEVRVSSD